MERTEVGIPHVPGTLCCKHLIVAHHFFAPQKIGPVLKDEFKRLSFISQLVLNKEHPNQNKKGYGMF